MNASQVKSCDRFFIDPSSFIRCDNPIYKYNVSLIYNRNVIDVQVWTYVYVCCIWFDNHKLLQKLQDNVRYRIPISVNNVICCNRVHRPMGDNARFECRTIRRLSPSRTCSQV